MNEDEVLAWLEKHGSRRGVEAMARYGIPNDGAFGVPMGTLLAFA
jgi:3-methyladenine DNA glycosylase AlkD